MCINKCPEVTDDCIAKRKGKRQPMERISHNPNFTGSQSFIEELKKRTFKDGSTIVEVVPPDLMTSNYLKENGFLHPMVVNQPEGLGLSIPPITNLYDLENYIGATYEVEVIDVEKQTALKLEFSTFLRSLRKPKRTKIYNLLSLEVSRTPLDIYLEPPKVARELDWVWQYWPMDLEEIKPRVSKYILISPKNAYTDFHIDFGGTSVWYHVVKGEKVFYLIRPTEANLSLYWAWNESRNRLYTFFADQVDECFKFTVRAGQTLFLPTGWIHAVLTIEDSFIYGGNFLHSLNIEKQLAVYSMERKANTPEKYSLPHYGGLHWLAAKNLVSDLEKLNRKQMPAPKYIINGLKSMNPFLRQWMQSDRLFFPTFEQANNFLKELNKQVRNADRLLQILNPPKPERGSTRPRKRPVYDDFIDFSLLRKVPQKKPTVHKAIAEKPEDISLRVVNGRLKIKLKRLSTENLPMPMPSTSSYKPNEDPYLLDSEPIAASSTAKGSSNITRIDRAPEKNTSQEEQEQPRVSHLDTSYRAAIDYILEENSLPDSFSQAPPKKLNKGLKKAKPSGEDELGGTKLVHQDDDYVYPSLELSDTENEATSSPYDKDDETWCPKAKVGKLVPKKDRPLRIGKRKIAVERGLVAAASNSGMGMARLSQKKKKIKTMSPVVRLQLLSPSKGSSKPKKGLATAKQRLGKILKLKKDDIMSHF